MLSKAERTRLSIVEKAAHLFNKRGFYGTSMNDIMEVTGLAKGGIYGHFGSKEEIVLEAFEYSFRKVSDELILRIKTKDNAPDKLLTILEYYRDYTLHSPIEGGCPVLNYTSHADSVPELKKALAIASHLMLETLQNILEKGKKYGQLKKSIKPSDEADIIYSRIEGAIMLSKATGNNTKLNLLLEKLKQYILTELKA
jgi:TetR/AcrR family transcriptional repressor of nem operon